MVIKFRTTVSGTKLITQAGEFKVGIVYYINKGHHLGKAFKLEYISPNKQIMIKQKRNRAVCGVLTETGVKVNSVVEHLGQ